MLKLKSGKWNHRNDRDQLEHMNPGIQIRKQGKVKTEYIKKGGFAWRKYVSAYRSCRCDITSITSGNVGLESPNPSSIPPFQPSSGPQQQ